MAEIVVYIGSSRGFHVEDFRPVRAGNKHINSRIVAVGCRVELRTQEGEKGLNSEEAERLVWAAQSIFATSCEPPQIPFS